MGAVIDVGAFKTHSDAIAEARSAGAEILAGGSTDDSEGYFVEPTVIATDDSGFRLLRDELFGPIVTTYVYDEKRWDDTLRLVDETAPYALTGAVFANERSAIERGARRAPYAAGNFYVNDKPTGAVVGQQPFGGSRASGTNDKAGSMWNLIRWVSPRTIKETFVSADGLPLPVPRSGRRRSRGRRLTQPRPTLSATGAGSAVTRVLDGIDAFLDQLAAVDYLPVFFAVLAQLAKLGCTSMAWRNVLAAAYPDEAVPRRSILARYLAGVGINAIVPMRAGDAVRIVLAHRAIPRSTYTTVVSSTLVLSIFDIARRLDASSPGRSSRRTSCRASASCPDLPSFDFGWLLDRPAGRQLILAAILIARRRPRVLDPRARRQLLGAGRQAFAVLRTPPRYLRSVALWQAGDWTFRLVAIWFLLDAFDIPQSLENVLLVQVSASIATLLPLTPAGIGTEQAFLLYVFRGAVPSSQLLAFSVGLKFMTVGTNVVAGFTAIALTLRTLAVPRMAHRGARAPAVADPPMQDDAVRAPDRTLARLGRPGLVQLRVDARARSSAGARERPRAPPATPRGTRSTEPKCSRIARRRAGPIPGRRLEDRLHRLRVPLLPVVAERARGAPRRGSAAGAGAPGSSGRARSGTARPGRTPPPPASRARSRRRAAGRAPPSPRARPRAAPFRRPRRRGSAICREALVDVALREPARSGA